MVNVFCQLNLHQAFLSVYEVGNGHDRPSQESEEVVLGLFDFQLKAMQTHKMRRREK